MITPMEAMLIVICVCFLGSAVLKDDRLRGPDKTAGSGLLTVGLVCAGMFSFIKCVSILHWAIGK